MTWLTSIWAFYFGLPAFVLAVLALVYWIMVKTTSKTPADEQPVGLQAALERLLTSGHDRGFAAIGFKSSKQTMQVRKYIHAKGDYGLEMSVPFEDWPSSRLQTFRDICSRNGNAYTIDPEAPDDRAQFLQMDFGTDAAAAFQMIDSLGSNVLNLPADNEPFWTLHGIADELGLIDDPSRKPPAGHDLVWKLHEIEHRAGLTGVERHRLLERELARHGERPTDALWSLLWFLAGPMAAIALLYTLPWKLLWLSGVAKPALPAQDLDLFGVPLHLRSFDLVCLALAATAAAMERIPVMRRLHGARRWETRPQVILRRVIRGRLLPFILIVTVVLWFV